jgi:UDP-N-acetylglucosamine--N-acetylmuramyl-(pentapeptide) pyrophosphoryl-undecaprenol N-acetylglucosamine transferase
VSLEGSVKEFSQGFNLFATKRSAKIFHTGNPVRTSVLHGHRSEAKTYFRFVSDLPTLLVTGGGTGAEFLNLLVKETLPQLCKVFNVIHIYGRQKTAATSSEGYFATPFLDRMDLVYAISDIVVTRAGLSTISELANLGKVSILIPMPNTHQEANAFYLGQLGAALVLAQEEIIPEQFLTTLSSLRLDGDRQKELSQNIRSIMPHDSVSRMEKIINTVIHGQ